MSRQIVFTPKAGKPPATYSQAVKAAGLVFISGTAPHDRATGAIKGTTIQEQTRQCLANVAAILEEAGSSLDKIVSATVVLADEEDFASMNEEWLRWFKRLKMTRDNKDDNYSSNIEEFTFSRQCTNLPELRRGTVSQMDP